jgi:O-antigen/teichoic acid export membrane protein
MMARRFTLFVAAQSLSAALGYVGLYLLSWSYGDEGLGMLALGLAVAGVAEYFTRLGFENAHMKRVAEGHDRACGIGTLLCVKLLLTPVACIAAAIAFQIIPGLADTTQHQVQRQIVFLMLGQMAFRSLTNVPIVTFAAERETIRQVAPGLLSSVVRVAGIALAVGCDLDIRVAAAAYVAAEASGLAFGGWLFRGHEIRAPTRESFRSYAIFALPMMVVGLSSVLEMHLDKVVLASFVDSAAVGRYFAAQLLTRPFGIVGAAVGAIHFPQAANLFVKAGAEKVRELAYETERYLLFLLAPVVVYVWLFADPLMATLGGRFSEGAPVLRLLATAELLTVVTQPYQDQLGAVDRPDRRMWASLSGRLIQVSLLFLLVPDDLGPFPCAGLGPVGAAVAWLSSRAIMALVSRVLCHRTTGAPFRPNILAAMVVAAAVGSALCSVSQSIDQERSITFLLVMVPGTALIYWLTLAGLRLLRWEDAKAVWRVVRRS